MSTTPAKPDSPTPIRCPRCGCNAMIHNSDGTTYCLLCGPEEAPRTFVWHHGRYHP